MTVAAIPKLDLSVIESICKVLAETETRDLTKKENEKVDTLLVNIDDNDVAITRAEKIENSFANTTPANLNT